MPGVTLSTGGESEQKAGVFVVYKHPLCFCCTKWVNHLKENNISVSTSLELDMGTIRKQWGIPRGMEGCHTAVWHNKYVFEGHVPASYIQKFLLAPPEGGIGLLVPGMPVGSPGMEVDGKFEAYNIYLLLEGGDYRPFARVETSQP
ncbi:DUF411 domain-containing protein [Microbulbifer sp. OS29]|uniref:DUF411 domain-containing protein n=1 Tax=Microbulbifer okhotskensis TaxID=2926617 RepID=A0A9X2EMC4_9GAMM|nr:DUF411 domain-containing protein [Microbulbifer okhotskensis]MCO1334346.1 DUF411 domain-containing protein [Microbulbifer okhotskensis]